MNINVSTYLTQVKVSSSVVELSEAKETSDSETYGALEMEYVFDWFSSALGIVYVLATFPNSML